MTAVLYDVPGPKARRRSLCRPGGLAAARWSSLVLPRLAKDQFEGERWSVSATRRAAGPLDGWSARSRQQPSRSCCPWSSACCSRRPAVERAGLRVPVRVWVELFRGLPLLLVILFLFLGGPASASTRSFWSLVIGLTLYNSAVIAEIVRAGVLSLPRGQREGALAVGLRPARRCGTCCCRRPSGSCCPRSSARSSSCSRTPASASSSRTRSCCGPAATSWSSSAGRSPSRCTSRSPRSTSR